MTRCPVSVVVVSRDRPDALARCLIGLSQLYYPRFEIIVVADDAGCAAARDLPFAESLTVIPFGAPNISEARNIGISAAAGEWVAFIDDDAVPEPTWLNHLFAAETDEVSALGGFVIGRNGISFQWKARLVGPDGHAAPLDVQGLAPVRPDPPEGGAVKTEGTNMAVRRDVLAGLGAFDPAYRFFLDETDLNMRLAQAGHATCLAPAAQVHHGFDASPRRRKDRVPRDLYEIGASWAVFQRKFIDSKDIKAHWQAIQKTERARLVRHMVSGALEPRDVRRLMRGLRAGYAEGQTRTIGEPVQIGAPTRDFAPFPSTPRAPEVVTKHWLFRARARRQAARLAREGKLVTLILLSRTVRKMSVSFSTDGYWEHIGGVYGESERKSGFLTVTTFRARAKREYERTKIVREDSGENKGEDTRSP